MAMRNFALQLALILSIATQALSHDPIRYTKAGVPFVRTPEARFNVLKDFNYTTKYVSVEGLRMAYVDVGRPKSGTVLLLHGEPDWAYLYRRMIPIFVSAGYRVLVPDLIGFGRSDKPVLRDAYSYKSHVSWMAKFVRILRLKNVNAFLQDWGGPIGLTTAVNEPFRFNRFILANTFMPAGSPIPGFEEFREFSQTVQPFDAADVIGSLLSTRNLTMTEKAAYRAPYPSELYLAGARQFPLLVPVKPTDVGAQEIGAARMKLRSWKKPVLLLWGLKDPLLGKLHLDFKNLIPGTKDQPHQLFPQANHFIQEEIGETLAKASVNWLMAHDPKSIIKKDCNCNSRENALHIPSNDL